MKTRWNEMTMGERIKLVAVSAFAACVLLFIIQNSETVQVSFLWWTFALARWIMLPLFFLLGGLAGYLLARTRSRRR